MSGGAMEYAFTRINQAAEQAEEYLERTKQYPLDEFKFDAGRANLSPEEMRERVLVCYKTAVTALRIASVYAQRVEWLMSGDDGFDSFVSRTSEDLEELEKELVEKGYPNGIVLSRLRGYEGNDHSASGGDPGR